VIEPTYLSVAQVFQRYICEVPRYQRGYTWDEPQVEDFIRDLQKCIDSRGRGEKRAHFFGGVVAVDRQVTSSALRRCDLIDGQQRITTFVLLIRALELAYRAIATHAAEANDAENQRLADDRARRLRSDYLTFEDEVNRRTEQIDRLKLSKPDRQYFADLLHQEPAEPTDDRESHARLYAALKSIQDWLRKLTSRENALDQKLEIYGRFNSILIEDCSLIFILSKSEMEAYRLFQVLNDRGTNLSEGDLLRASTLELVSADQFTRQHDSIAEMWDDILRDQPKVTEDFLRWYYSSVTGKRPGQTSLFDEFSSEFFQVPASGISAAQATSIATAVSKIRDEVRVFRLLIEGEWPYPSSRTKLWFRDRLRLLLRELDHTNAIPLLLAARHLTEKKFVEVVLATERFAFRYKHICNLHPGSLTKVYLEQAKAIRREPGRYRIQDLRAEYKRLQDSKATDALFGAQLDHLTYQPEAGNKVLKYFLTTLEHYWAWYESGSAGEPNCRDTTRVFDFGDITLEHIWSQKHRGRTSAALKQLVHNFGNITLLGLEENDAAANNSYQAKRPHFSRSSMIMNRKLAESDSWNATTIRQRADLLKKIALKVFRVL
jgi:hypothetical protein